MTFSVCFITRREIVSPSIERVFRSVAENLEARGIETKFARVPFGDGIAGTLLNLIFFRPPKADLLHITGHVNYLGLVLPRDRTISTVHDLIILDFRSGLRRWVIEKLLFVWPARRLRFLTAISEATKTRLVTLTGVAPEKVRVIQNPLLIAHSERRDFNIPNTQILQIGTAPYKNVERIVSAISGLSCELHIVGMVSDNLRKHIEEQNVLLDHDKYLDDKGIETAYEEADVLTLCSTDEGFGLPIIEAQAKQTVVVTSDRSPMKDVAGGGAMLVDPDDVASIRAGILKVISDPILREDIIQKGLRNVERFDPTKIAADYLALYETVLTELRN